MSNRIKVALAATLEVTGTYIGDQGMRAMYSDLLRQSYSEETIIEALRLVREQCTGKVTLAHILDRLPTRHPSHKPYLPPPPSRPVPMPATVRAQLIEMGLIGSTGEST